MNISIRDKKLLIILIGIAIFFAAYLGIYNNFNDRTEILKSELSALSPRLAELREYSANMSMYESGIALISGNVDAELSKFPQDVRSEDMIMYVTSIQKAIGITVDSISFAPPEVISTLSIPSSGPSGLSFVPYAALRTGLSIECGLTYPQTKKLVDYIYSTPHRTALDSLSISYNSETGALSGSAALSKYFVCGEDYVYTATDIPNISQGTSNPFGAINVAGAGAAATPN